MKMELCMLLATVVVDQCRRTGFPVTKPEVSRLLLSTMKISSTFHPSSSVISSTKCRLASRDVEHLVVAKLHRVDLYSLRPHGLQHECGLDIWGLVCSVKPIPISVGWNISPFFSLSLITKYRPQACAPISS